MAHPGLQTTFLDDGGTACAMFGIILTNQLEGDLPIESGVPRPIDVAESASANWLDDPQGAPLARYG